MSILIKGMEMPHDCAECPLDWNECEYINGFDTVDHSDKKRPDNCPLIEIPPHGDLVDRDELMRDVMDSDLDHLQRDDWKEIIQIISDAPTVIEGD